MQNYQLTLLGGLHCDGRLERQAQFHALTGLLEQKIGQTEKESDRVAFVSSVLTAAIASIGNQSVNADLIDQLCIADRQYLMLRLANYLNGDQLWLNATCAACDSLFDVEINRSQLPTKQAGEGYPYVDIRLDKYQLKVRVPNGADQKLAANCVDDDQALLTILNRCIESVNGRTPPQQFVESLSQDEIAAIDEALDEVSPAVCSQLDLICPECGKQQVAEIDHYHTDGLSEASLYSEIHTLASHYHWSESDILNLPREKRHRYVQMINNVSGHG